MHNTGEYFIKQDLKNATESFESILSKEGKANLNSSGAIAGGAITSLVGFAAPKDYDFFVGREDALYQIVGELVENEVDYLNFLSKGLKLSFSVEKVSKRIIGDNITLTHKIRPSVRLDGAISRLITLIKQTPSVVSHRALDRFSNGNISLNALLSVVHRYIGEDIPSDAILKAQLFAEFYDLADLSDGPITDGYPTLVKPNKNSNKKYVELYNAEIERRRNFSNDNILKPVVNITKVQNILIALGLDQVDEPYEKDTDFINRSYMTKLSNTAVTLNVNNKELQLVYCIAMPIEKRIETFDFLHTKGYYSIADDSLTLPGNVEYAIRDKELIFNISEENVQRKSYNFMGVAKSRIERFESRGFKIPEYETLRLEHIASKLSTTVEEMLNLAPGIFSDYEADCNTEAAPTKCIYESNVPEHATTTTMYE